LTPRIDERWIRHDWRMWIRPDFARWIKPGVDPADVIPGLARERAELEARRAREEAARAAEDAAFAAEIEHERRAWAALKEEMKEVNAEMARWRRRVADAAEAKYSPSQPRVPKRNPGAGQWTRIGGGIGQSPSSNIAKPMGNVDFGDVTALSELDQARNVRAGELDVAARGNEAECDLQYKRDKLICNLVRTPLCWAQAAERYAACLSGRPIPQLRF
jgi:hypothetical protein